MMLLELRRLKKEYPRDNASFAAVNDVSVSIGEGERIYITGRSGSGKSTLLNMIAGLLKPTSGEILFEARELSNLEDGELSFLRNSRIGYIPQGRSVLANFTVLDNVKLPFYLYRRHGNPTERALRLLEQVGILHLANAYPAELSGGELRRVVIARSLVNAPRLLLADEPTGDLDPETTEEVIKLFAQVSRDNGAAILLVTHDKSVVRNDGRHFLMDSGNLSEVERENKENLEESI
ncbi:MAG: ABC transporter ATP-binding protein [Synergistaceae bacterium]|jgi:putative ABC transport system ATP-binding protein|nr:ABC transporter ATP-binding protein [Synergistaceae bacterium]